MLATLGRQYRAAVRGFAGMRNLEVWYARLDEDAIREQLRNAGQKKLTQKAEKGAAKARAKDSLRALGKLTERVDGELRIVSRPPLIVPLEELLPADEKIDVEAMLAGVLERYAETLKGDRRRLLETYTLRHVAHKVVGVGSVGTRAWILLLTGRDDEDPLFLQAKEAQASVLEPYAGASEFDNHGQRVVEGQWLMQAASDRFLGWCPVVGIDDVRRDFYVRQLWDGKGSTEVEGMPPAGLEIYARLCGWTLARAHARSGDASRSAPTSAPASASTKRWPSSLGSTRTRTNATTRRSKRRSTPAACRSRTPEAPTAQVGSADGEMGSARRPRGGAVPDGPRPGGDERRDLPARRGLRHDGDDDPDRDRASTPW